MAPSPTVSRASASPSTPSRRGKDAASSSTSKLRGSAEGAKKQATPRSQQRSPPKLKKPAQQENVPSTPPPQKKAPPQQQPEISEPEDDQFTGSLDTGQKLAKSAAGGVSSGVQKGAKTAKEGVESGAKAVQENIPIDLSSLKGLEVGEGGQVFGKDGNPIGRVSEGDPEDLVGQTIGDNGEILDEDGDLVGIVEVLPEAAKGAAGQAKDKAGEAVEGVEETAGQAKDEAGEAVEGVEETAGEAKDKVGEAGQEVEENLRDFDIDFAGLDGFEVGENGEIRNSSGVLLARVVEGDPEDLVGYTLNDQGEVVDDDGDAIGRVEIAEKKDEVGGELQDKLPTDEAKQAPSSLGDITSKIPGLEKLAGLEVNDAGDVVNDDGDVIGKLEGGNLEDVVGKQVNEQGLILDDKDNVLGQVGLVEGAKEAGEEAGEEVGEKAEEVGEEAEEAEPELPDISTLEGLKCNKQGRIVNENGDPVGELIEGNARNIWKYGAQLDAEGRFWDNRGNQIGKAKTLPIQEEEEGPFAGLEGLIVVKDGWVEDENGTRVGQLVEGDAKKLVGRAVDTDGDILDSRGNAIGRTERYEEPEEEAPDLSILRGLSPNKQGNVIGPDGVPIAKVSYGNPKELAGRKIDEEGRIFDDAGSVIGQCELIPEDERETKAEGPFAGLEGLVVTKEGYVQDEDGRTVGKLEEGDPKKLRGRAVDEDGDVCDKHGNVLGHAEPYEEPEEEQEVPDLSVLAGNTINKLGYVTDESGVAYGRIVSGDPRKLAGKKVGDDGKVYGDKGEVIATAEVIPESEREKPEGPFSGLEGLVVGKDGVVQDASGDIVGRLVEGDAKKLKGRMVDDEGEVLSKTGQVLGKAERWEPEEEKPEVNPMSGRKVTREGEVRDADGNLIGKLTEGNLKTLIGKKIDDNGYVIDNKGNKVGECTLLENLPEDEISPEELEKRKQAENDKELAKKMSTILQQTLEKVDPILKMITELTEKADRTPKEELDEEKLVNDVKPLIEQGSSILQECNGAIRALDPDGRIAATAKARAAQREASPEEYQLADLLKELTSNVVTTIDKAKKRIADMPHAKKELNPLWGLLTEPLFQIIAAVGLLLTGVLGLVGRLLNGLGLGGIVNNLLGGLGLNRLFDSLGLGSLVGSMNLGGDKKKK